MTQSVPERTDARKTAAWAVKVALGGVMSAALLLAAPAEGRGDPKGPQAPAASPAPATPFDQPLAWLEEARKVHRSIRDYTCTLVKQERIRGELQAENIILAKFRTEPFSVYMRWLAPRKFKGQEVCYVHGRNRNRMRVHSKGLLGVVGFVSIDADDPRVLQHSRHRIYEAGIGNLIERTAQCWQRDRQVGNAQVRVAEFDFAGRRCLRVETIHPERRQDLFCYRHLIYLDKETKLPVRTECYDWPREGGPAEGDLLEVFSFLDLRFNVGLDDRHFNR